MNDLVAEKAHNVFGNHWAYIGFNDIATDKTFVFDSDNSSVLSAFSPTWYQSHVHGPRGTQGRHLTSLWGCGLLSTKKVYIGYWGETHCESATYRSICE